MKMRFLLLLSLFSFACSVNAISICFYVNGYWGTWHETFFYGVYGNYGGFCFYEKSDHPSEYLFRFTITNYIPPTKEMLKKARKSNTWLEYTGTAEYYVNDDNPTIDKLFMDEVFLSPKKISDRPTRPIVKRTAKARIRIRPYKDHPRVYNIWFDNVAFGIDLEDCFFKQ
jgi:hypothetical protein